MSSGKPRERSLAEQLIKTSRALTCAITPLEFSSPVRVVYNPLEYGRDAHEAYISRFANRGVTVLLGMNPGPWGMAQTAVPFGAVKWVRDWMKLDVRVGKPKAVHPKRPVQGFDCPRNEVSGDRLWGWAADRFGTPEAFFDEFFVWNYCPVSFMIESGANFIPEKLAKDERERLFEICDSALREMVEILEPKMIIGVGKFAADRARKALPEDLEVGQVLHPSPASPAANKGWVAVAEKQLTELGVV